MTTKEQERKVLTDIMNMVKELGEDSYIATAFDGVCEIASSNIRDDAAYSARYYIDETHKLQGTINQMTDKHEDYMIKMEGALERSQESLVKCKERCNAMVNRDIDQGNRIDELNAQIAKRDTEITMLKAKLYDMMTAGA